MRSPSKNKIASRDLEALPRSLNVLKKGGLLGIPTETVYGLAADALNSEAVARIYEAKQRPSFNPLIAHCCDIQMARQYVRFDKLSESLAEAFWPGPLTLVLPLRDQAPISNLLLAGLSTLAVRVPLGIAQDVIKAFGAPLAAPSANLSGRLSPTCAAHVLDQLADNVDLVLDDGPTKIGLESTIVTVKDDQVVILRSGGIEAETIERLLKRPVSHAASGGTIVAPGMMTSHYAPLGTLRLNAREIDDEDGAINFGLSDLQAQKTSNLSKSGNLREAASNLFSQLADFDRSKSNKIAVAPIPSVGLGIAINDRLMRAAAPRS